MEMNIKNYDIFRLNFSSYSNDITVCSSKKADFIQIEYFIESQSIYTFIASVST